MSKIFPEILDVWNTPSGSIACIMKTRKRLFGGRKYDLLVRVQDGWYLEITVTDKDFYELSYEYIGHLDFENLFNVEKELEK